MTFLLDTNACIALINGKPAAVRTRLKKALDGGAQVLVPTVAAFELWYRVAKSTQQAANARRVETFFAGPLSRLPFEDEDARIAGQVRAAMEAAGTPMGAYDLLIASQALRHKLTLVTANAREFARVSRLLWEDWSKS